MVNVEEGVVFVGNTQNIAEKVKEITQILKESTPIAEIEAIDDKDWRNLTSVIDQCSRIRDMAGDNEYYESSF